MNGSRSAGTPSFTGLAARGWSGAGKGPRLRRRDALLAGALLALSLLAALTVRAVPAQGAFPGQNGRIACSGVLAAPTSDPAASRLELFGIDPDGSGEGQLTNNTESDFAPKFSPDGRRIAFQRGNQIWTMNADGTGETRLTTTIGSNIPGSWSPDGTQIVFQSTRDPLPPGAPPGSNATEIYRMNADGTNQTRLTTNLTQDAFPAWSPDGSKILFRTNRDGNPNLYTMNPDGSAPTQLTSTPAEESGPAWSPDGRQIAFHTDRDAFPGRALNRNLEIYRMNADGTGETRLTFSDFSGGGDPNRDLTGYDLFPAWSPEGDRIVFHSGRAPEYRETGQSPFIAQWEVFSINAAVGEAAGLQRLTTRPGNDERCDWQPLPRAAVSPPAADSRPPAVAASRACVARSFRARVRVDEPVRSVVVSLNGRRIRTTTSASFTVRVPARRLRRGINRLTVVATDVAGNRTRRTFRFRACAGQRPQFTG